MPGPRRRVVYKGNDTSNRLRKRLFMLRFDSGLSVREIKAGSEEYRIPLSQSTIYTLLSQFEQCLSYTKKAWLKFKDDTEGRTGGARAAGGPRAPRVDPALVGDIKGLLDGDPCLFLDEIQAKLRPRWGKKSLSTITRVIHGRVADGNLGMTLQVMQAQASQRCRLERLDFLTRIQDSAFPGRQVIAIDESHKVRLAHPQPATIPLPQAPSSTPQTQIPNPIPQTPNPKPVPTAGAALNQSVACLCRVAMNRGGGAATILWGTGFCGRSFSWTTSPSRFSLPATR